MCLCKWRHQKLVLTSPHPPHLIGKRHCRKPSKQPSKFLERSWYSRSTRSTPAGWSHFPDLRRTRALCLPFSSSTDGKTTPNFSAFWIFFSTRAKTHENFTRAAARKHLLLPSCQTRMRGKTENGSRVNTRCTVCGGYSFGGLNFSVLNFGVHCCWRMSKLWWCLEFKADLFGSECNVVICFPVSSNGILKRFKLNSFSEFKLY